MRLVCVVILMGFLAGCASSMKVGSPEFQKIVQQPKAISSSKSKCITATKAALKEQGYKLKKASGGKLLTSRREFVVNAESRPVVESETNKSQRFQMKQSDQLWINITGSENECSIQVSKIRLWNGVEEMLEIQGAGAEWARKHIVEALYREVDANI